MSDDRFVHWYNAHKTTHDDNARINSCIIENYS